MHNLFSLQSPDSPPAQPSPSPQGPSPQKFLAVFLHGYGSDERDLAGLSEYLPEGVPWASVRAPLRHPSFGYSWYQLEVDFSPSASIVEATDTLWSWVDANVPASTLLVPVGFSQGAMMATQLLRTRPERIGATVALSGYVSSAPQPADAALEQTRPPLFWGRGDQDPVIPRAEVTAASEWFDSHTNLEARIYQGMSHSVSETELSDVRRFLSRELG